MSAGSSSGGSAAVKQLMRGLFLRPTTFQISNMAQSLAVLHHFHRLAQRADAAAAAAAAARGAGDQTQKTCLEHGGLYSVHVPRNALQQRPLRWSFAAVSPDAARAIAPAGLPTMHWVEVPSASATRRSHIGLRDIQPYIGLPLTPEEEAMLDGLAYEAPPEEGEEDEGVELWDGEEGEREGAELGELGSAADGTASKFVTPEDADDASAGKKTVMIEVKAELSANLFPQNSPVSVSRARRHEPMAAEYLEIFDGFASSTQRKARTFIDSTRHEQRMRRKSHSTLRGARPARDEQQDRSARDEDES